MPDVKEKLVELLCEAHNKAIDAEAFADASYAQQIEMEADYLIANGVSIPIRCKDCNHWLKDVPGCTDAIGRCRFGNYMVGAAGYCVYGERRTNEAEN